jgi:hypothetical protein
VDERTAASHVPLAIAMLAPLRTLVLVDASDLRCTRSMIRRHLSQGFMVLISGSRFAGGPASTAALLVPPDIAERLSQAPASPVNVQNAASFDLSRAMRGWIGSYGSVANLGLGLRWSAALAELTRYYGIERDMRAQIVDYFDRKVRSRAALCHFIALNREETHAHDRWALSRIPLLLPADMVMNDARAIHEDLMRPYDDMQGDAICHIGQVHIAGPRLYMSAAINAAQIADIAERISKGISFDRACAPLMRDIDTLMRKWEMLDLRKENACHSDRLI